MMKGETTRWGTSPGRMGREACAVGRKKREWPLFFLCLSAALYGLALIFSATRYEETLHGLVGKQAVALGGGVVLCLLLSVLDVRKLLEKLWWLLPVVNVGLLLLLVPLGNDDGTGNKSWISLPGGGFNLQPAEVVKISFLLLLALQLRKLGEKGLNRPKAVFLLLLHVLALCALLYGVSGDIGMVAVYLEGYGVHRDPPCVPTRRTPDLIDAGMVAVYLAVYLVMLWSAGVHPLWLLGEVAAGVGAVVLLWPRLPEYVRMRFLVVFDHGLDPLGKGFQQERSLLAIGSGQVTGQGYLQGTQTQSPSPSALPARHTDFIFSVAGEELGLVGCLLILALLGAILFRCVWLAHRSRDPLFAAVAMGVAGVFGAQTILNIGMCLYVAPVVGVTLPFFSYGGSSLLTAFGGVGIVMSMKQEKLGGSGNWPGA